MIVRSITIGRAPDCDLRVTDEYASPRHCRIDQLDTGRFTITDLASTNGTYVRRAGLPGLGLLKVRLGTGIELRVGDMVRVGRTEIPWRNA